MNRIIEVFSEKDMAYIESANEIMKNTLEVLRKNKQYNTYTVLPKVFFTEDDKTHVACYSQEYNAIYVNSSVVGKGVDYFTQVILHEFAHFVCVNFHNTHGHGDKFKEICALIDCKFNTPYDKSKESLSCPSDLESKIFKLLRLSESSNVNEASSALDKARKLMIKANISLTEEDKIYRVTLHECKKVDALYSTVSYVVGKALGIYVVNNRTSVTRIVAHGTKEQLEIASYMFDCLILEFKKQLEIAKKKGYIASKASFYRGVGNTILNTFNADSESTYALALSSEAIRNIAHDVLYKGWTTSSTRKTRVNSSDYAQGQLRGSKVSLYKGTYAHDSGKYLN